MAEYFRNDQAYVVTAPVERGTGAKGSCGLTVSTGARLPRPWVGRASTSPAGRRLDRREGGVKIDGVAVGKVGMSSTVEFPAAPGSHEGKVAQTRYRSASLTIHFAEGQPCDLITRPKLPVVGLFMAHRYLSLKPKTAE